MRTCFIITFKGLKSQRPLLRLKGRGRLRLVPGRAGSDSGSREHGPRASLPPPPAWPVRWRAGVGRGRLSSGPQLEGVGSEASHISLVGLPKAIWVSPGSPRQGETRSPRGRARTGLMGTRVPGPSSRVGRDARDGGGGEPGREKSALQKARPAPFSQ